MKIKYLIIALTVFSIVSCKKNEMDESSSSMDSIEQTDASMIADTNLVVQDSSDVKLLDTMSTSTTKIITDTSKGKFALAETKWRLVEVNGKSVKSNNEKDYFINLDSKSGKFTGFVGCNSIMGSFVMIDATKLQFSNVASTKMACPDMKIESKFMKMLEKVENYSIEGTTLFLNKSNSDDVLKFEAVK